MITSVRNYGRCGITGVYIGFMNHFNIGSLSTRSFPVLRMYRLMRIIVERGVRLNGNGSAPVSKYWEQLLKMI